MSAPGRDEVDDLPSDLDGLLSNMARDLEACLRSAGREEVVMIGIHTGGVWVADRLHELLQPRPQLGALNINFYRDDFTRTGLHPQVTPSDLSFPVDDAHVVLVDDVLYTGRTIRAAMNEIFDYGRPASVTLAVMVERGGRELPIQADVRGCTVALAPGEYVKLTGPEPLGLERRRAQ